MRKTFVNSLTLVKSGALNLVIIDLKAGNCFPLKKNKMKKGAITSYDPNVFVTVARIIILPEVNKSVYMYIHTIHIRIPLTIFLQSNNHKIQTRVSDLTLYSINRFIDIL